MKKSVLVTGANGGLGLETALTLAEQGFDVWASMRDLTAADMVDEAAKERGVELHLIHLDITDPASVAEAIETMVQRAGGIYGLVNNAGITLKGYFEDLTESEIRRVIEVNLFGTMNVTRSVLPYMRAARCGRVVVMSSVAGRIGSMGLTAYVASKFALEGFAESLSLEVAPLGIQVVIVEPGIVNTPIWGANRRIAARAEDPQSLYYHWFHRAEREADALVRSSKVTPARVAATVREALTVKRPRLRYMVGRRAALVVGLRRHVPGEIFERMYFGEVLRRVTASGPGDA